jgi:hypothetical protein
VWKTGDEALIVLFYVVYVLFFEVVSCLISRLLGSTKFQTSSYILCGIEARKFVEGMNQVLHTLAISSQIHILCV